MENLLIRIRLLRVLQRKFLIKFIIYKTKENKRILNIIIPAFSYNIFK